MTTVTIKATQIVRHFLDDAPWISGFGITGTVRAAHHTVTVSDFAGDAQVAENNAIHFTTNFDSYDLILTVRYDSGEVAKYKLHR